MQILNKYKNQKSNYWLQINRRECRWVDCHRN